MITLLRAELRSRWRTVASLAAGSFILLLALAGTYSAYGGEGAFNKAFGGAHAPSLFSAFAGTSGVNIFEPASFLAFGFTHPLFLVLAIASGVAIGVGSVAGDVDTGRAELLYACPVRRSLIFDARAFACVIAQVAVVAAALAGAELGQALSGSLSSVSPLVPVRVGIQLLPLLLLFAAIAFTASALSRTRGEAMGLAVALPAGAYLINVVSLLWDKVSWLGHLDPFHDFQATAAAQSVNYADAIGLLGCAVVIYLLGREGLERRDLA